MGWDELELGVSWVWGGMGWNAVGLGWHRVGWGGCGLGWAGLEDVGCDVMACGGGDADWIAWDGLLG
jgi:hypothetical protein